MDPVTIVLVVVVGGVAAKQGFNPLILLGGGIFGIIFTLLPFAAMYSVYVNYQQGTLTPEMAGAAVYAVVLVFGFFLTLESNPFIFVLVWTVGFFTFVTFVPVEMVGHIAIGTICAGLAFLAFPYFRRFLK
jgi:hypothetical protein